jgi:ferredoxin-type protein NapH
MGSSQQARRPGWSARLKTQLISLLALNSYFLAPGGKFVCLPVLNCHACTLATTACPIGSLSDFVLMRQIPFYILGALGFIGASVGRLFCGWACPFGFVQDLLYRIRSPKWRLPRGVNALKYVMLLLFVLALPYWFGGDLTKTSSDRAVKQSTGTLDYCALVCPMGTLQAGVPSLLINPAIRKTMSWKSWLKLGILFAVLGLAIVSRRSFCRGLCPIGAAMALTSRVSLLRLRTDQDRCTHCQACVGACPTRARQVPEVGAPKEATAECLHCLDCVRTCPEAGALCATLGSKTLMASCGGTAAEAGGATGAA